MAGFTEHQSSFSNSAAATFDLNPILAKLCHPVKGLGWDRQRAENAIAQYRRWLWLLSSYPCERLVPSRDIDQVWHCHILDTKKYREDCKSLFAGEFLHHNPYAGWESYEAEAEHQKGFENTRKRFLEVFGEECSAGDALCAGGYCDDIRDNDAMWRPGAEWAERQAA